jgi:hypothetical protein
MDRHTESNRNPQQGRHANYVIAGQIVERILDLRDQIDRRHHMHTVINETLNFSMCFAPGSTAKFHQLGE